MTPVAKTRSALSQCDIIIPVYLNELLPNAQVIGVIIATDINAVIKERVAITSLFVKAIGPLIPTLTKTPSIDQNTAVNPPSTIPTIVFVVICFDSIKDGNKINIAEETIVITTPTQTFQGSFSLRIKLSIVIEITGYKAVMIAPYPLPARKIARRKQIFPSEVPKAAAMIK